MAGKKIDISALSLADLRVLSEEIVQEITNRAEAEKKALLSEFESRAKASGFTLSDLLGETTDAKKPTKKEGKPRKSGSVPPKYRNPKNSLETWTGRGRLPVWAREFKGAGGNLDDCLIEAKTASLLPTK